MRWHRIDAGNVPDGELLVLNIETGEVAISSKEDKPYRRGFRHRNGFPATHWHIIVPAIPPIDPHYRLKLQLEQ